MWVILSAESSKLDCEKCHGIIVIAWDKTNRKKNHSTFLKMQTVVNIIERILKISKKKSQTNEFNTRLEKREKRSFDGSLTKMNSAWNIQHHTNRQSLKNW